MKTLLFALSLFYSTATIAQTVKWKKLDYKPKQRLYSVYCLNYDTVVAVGDSGYIIRTNDSGTTWNSVSSNTNNALYKIKFVNDTIGYAIGEQGTILKTTNTGKSWTNISINTDLSFFSMSFINKDTGWVAGGEGDLLWWRLFGKKGILLKTTNGGTNWIVDSTYDKTVSSVCFVDNDTGYICVNNDYPFLAQLKKTTDGGKSFLVIRQDSLTEFYTDIYFTNAKIGYFVNSFHGGKDGIYKTTDFGNKWGKVLTQWSVKHLYVIDSCTMYASYSDMPGYGTYGRDSCLKTDIACPAFFSGMSFINKNYGFGVDDYIYKRDSVITDNIKKNEHFLNIILFPNPIINKTTIMFDSNYNSADLSITIYNTLGNLIINKSNIRENTVELNFNNYPNGMYYLIIKDNKEIIYCKKLIKL